MEATRSLRDDHRMILRVLDGFEKALVASRETGTATRDEFDPFLAFFRGFVEFCHHRKEQETLFVLLERKGLVTPGTPAALVLEEHDGTRDLVGRMSGNLMQAAKGDREACAGFWRDGQCYLEMIRKHADKEEHCLYGMAEQAIRGSELADLLMRYQRIEQDPLHRTFQETCRQIAEDVEVRYELPPLPAPSPRSPGSASHDPRVPSAVAAIRGGEQDAWEQHSAQLVPDQGSELERRVHRALESPALRPMRALLEQIGRRIEAAPMLWRMLPSGHLRLFFPVVGADDRIEDSTVVAVVLLYDVAHESTLYAHPVHAGPGANPLLEHLGGPMANPKAQEGSNGERATLRLLEHKQALWHRFVQERRQLGDAEAGSLWRRRYAWALVRLYFCERCSACRWGSPFMEGPGAEPFRLDLSVPAMTTTTTVDGPAVADAIRTSEPFRIEVRYAERGGFTIRDEPRLVLELEREHRLAVFPTDAEFLEGGTLVAAAAWFHVPTAEVRLVHCLAAGPEPEMIFRSGDRALGLPVPDAGAREIYAAWRREAWSTFWLDELEQGLHAASQRWLRSYWQALRQLFGYTPARARSSQAAHEREDEQGSR